MAIPPRPIQPLPIPPILTPDPPSPDQGLPLPQPPYGDPGTIDAIGWLRLLFPGFFDPNSPIYIDPPQVIAGMILLASEFRPTCLPERMQDIAQAYYAAHLLQEWLGQQETGGINPPMTNSGIVLSEKEGDIAVTYADPNANSAPGEVTGPGKTPWDKWNRLWQLCAKGAILTKYGDPVHG